MTGITRLDHVNLRTTRLAEMKDWYCAVLGLENGARPVFPFPGAWLYADGHALVHLVEVDMSPDSPQTDLHLEHFAFAATGLREMLDRAATAGSRTVLRPVPGYPIVQLNIWDPDGNHLHVDFDSTEAEGLELG